MPNVLVTGLEEVTPETLIWHHTNFRDIFRTLCITSKFMI